LAVMCLDRGEIFQQKILLVLRSYVTHKIQRRFFVRLQQLWVSGKLGRSRKRFVRVAKIERLQFDAVRLMCFGKFEPG
jgi:hypothetical protein